MLSGVHVKIELLRLRSNETRCLEHDCSVIKIVAELMSCVIGKDKRINKTRCDSSERTSPDLGTVLFTRGVSRMSSEETSGAGGECGRGWGDRD